METIKADVAVIGGGPGGYVCAIRASRLGLSVALVESDRLGGVCLNRGCIPTKALVSASRALEALRGASRMGIRAAEASIDQPASVKRAAQVADRMSKGVASLMKACGVRVVPGRGRLAALGRVEAPGFVVEAPRVVLASGASPKPLPGVPFDGVRVISSTEALRLEEIPPRLAVVGAGAIGMEFAYYYAVAGSAVTVIEALPTILPLADPEASAAVARAMRRRSVAMLVGAKVERASVSGSGVSLDVIAGGEARTVEADRMLVAIGVLPNTGDLWDPSLGIGMDGPFVHTDEHCLTCVPGVYAIGDIAGPPLLAHKASHEGIVAAEHMAGREASRKPPDRIPSVVYCQPQVGQVGLTEDRAREALGEVSVGRYPFIASGMAQACGEPEGFVKLVFDAGSGRLAGGLVVGAEASELVGEICLALEAGLTHERIHAAIHPHPTFSEAIMEAAAQAAGAPIHL